MASIFSQWGPGTVLAVGPWCWHWLQPCFGPMLILDRVVRQACTSVNAKCRYVAASSPMPAHCSVQCALTVKGATPTQLAADSGKCVARPGRAMRRPAPRHMRLGRGRGGAPAKLHS